VLSALFAQSDKEDRLKQQVGGRNRAVPSCILVFGVGAPSESRVISSAGGRSKTPF